jgi:uncharacterized tellurite resistance protein B-like protein
MWLLDKVHEHLRGKAPLARDRGDAPSDLELQAATAVLLLEAAYGDSEYVWHEHHAIVRGLEREFGLGRKQTLELLGRADEIRPPVVKLADVTEVLRDRFSKAQRQEVVRLVWRVVEADRTVEEWEESFADHIARALCLSLEEARAARASHA